MQLATPSTMLDPLPLTWASKLLARLTEMYGAQFLRQWDAVPAERLPVVWAEELAGYTGVEIARGLAACRQQKFPPTLPEFLMLCRPNLEPATAYQEAVAGMTERAGGGIGIWSHPAIYWAAVRVGRYDILSNGYQIMRSRWETALRAVMEQGRWDPVPEPRAALPAPGQTQLTREEAEQRLRELEASRVLQPSGDHRRWVRRTLERVARGESVPLGVLRRAREAAADMGATA